MIFMEYVLNLVVVLFDLSCLNPKQLNASKVYAKVTITFFQ